MIQLKSIGHLTFANAKNEAIAHAGKWCLQTQTALPPSDLPQSGYRDLYFDNPERYHWEHPRSNSAERITVYLKLYHKLGDDRYLQAAIKYADAMFDPAFGIYDGPDERGRGQVWYWRDNGSYMTNYTMRVPPAFWELYEETKCEKYKHGALAAGEALLYAQQDTGILLEGFLPANFEELNLAKFDHKAHPEYVTNYKINSRVGYAVYAFALLYQKTGDTRYRQAMDKLIAGLKQFQYPDGSFPCDLATNNFQAVTPLVKNHFLSYILNGLGAAMRIIDDRELKLLATKLADYAVKQIFRSGSWPYGSIDNFLPAEALVWQTAGADIAWGLGNMAKATGDQRCLQAADRILLTALGNQAVSDNPDLDGAFAIWLNGEPQLPALGGYFHFFTMLALLDE